MFVEEVHHSHAVLEAHDQVETRRVQGKAVCRLVEVTDDFQSELVFLVRPNTDCPVSTARGKKLLLYANVQPVHLL
jgi:hypothetical protein